MAVGKSQVHVGACVRLAMNTVHITVHLTSSHCRIAASLPVLAALMTALVGVPVVAIVAGIGLSCLMHLPF